MARATAKYIVKRASFHCAQRNPFKPRQNLKRGKWATFGEFDTPEAAFERAKQLTGGLTDVAVFLRGKRITAMNYGRLEWSNEYLAERMGCVYRTAMHNNHRTTGFWRGDDFIGLTARQTEALLAAK